MEDGREEQILKGHGMIYRLPLAYVRGLGPDEAAIAFEFANIVRKRDAQLAKGIYPEYSVGGQGAFTMSDEDMAKSFPWMCLRTYKAKKKKLIKVGIIACLDNPHGKSRYSKKLGKLVRNPLMYSMKPEDMRVALDTRKRLDFFPDDAVKLHSLSAALVWNHVCYLFEKQVRVNPDNTTMPLVPKKLEAAIKLKASTIRNALGTFVADGRLRKVAGIQFAASEYEIVANPLADKAFKEVAPVRTFAAPDDLTADEVKEAIAQMQDDVTYWYSAKTGQAILPADEIHFRKAAEICFYNHYNPAYYVSITSGTGDKRKPCFMHGVSAEAKYLKHFKFDPADICFGKYDIARFKNAIKYNRWRQNRWIGEGKYATLDDTLADETNSLPAWYRVVTCAPDSPILDEIINKFSGKGAIEIQDECAAAVEALFLVEGIYPSRLFPYYWQYFDYLTATVDAPKIEPIEPDLKWEVGRGYKYTDSLGQEQFTRDKKLALLA